MESKEHIYLLEKLWKAKITFIYFHHILKIFNCLIVHVLTVLKVARLLQLHELTLERNQNLHEQSNDEYSIGSISISVSF